MKPYRSWTEEIARCELGLDGSSQSVKCPLVETLSLCPKWLWIDCETTINTISYRFVHCSNHRRECGRPWGCRSETQWVTMASASSLVRSGFLKGNQSTQCSENSYKYLYPKYRSPERHWEVTFESQEWSTQQRLCRDHPGTRQCQRCCELPSWGPCTTDESVVDTWLCVPKDIDGLGAGWLNHDRCCILLWEVVLEYVYCIVLLDQVLHCLAQYMSTKHK